MKRFATAVVILLVGAGLACAQQQGTAAGGQSEGSKLQWARKSSDIVDKKIESLDGKELGKVEDLVIGPDGRIQYLILGTGGFAGIGKDKYAVPWDKVRAGDKVDTLVADLPQAEIRKFTEGEKKASRDTAQDQAQQGGQRAASVEQWKDKKVVAQNGDELGTVKNIYSDQNNQAKYLIVQAPSGKLHPVPPDMLQPSPGDQSKLQARFDRQTLDNAPEFDRQQANQSRDQWEQSVRGYYDSAGKGQGKQQ